MRPNGDARSEGRLSGLRGRELSRHDLSRHDLSRHDLSRHDLSRHDLSKHDLSKHDLTIRAPEGVLASRGGKSVNETDAEHPLRGSSRVHELAQQVWQPHQHEHQRQSQGATSELGVLPAARLRRAVPAGGRPSSPGGGSKPSPPWRLPATVSMRNPTSPDFSYSRRSADRGLLQPVDGAKVPRAAGTPTDRTALRHGNAGLQAGTADRREAKGKTETALMAQMSVRPGLQHEKSD